MWGLSIILRAITEASMSMVFPLPVEDVKKTSVPWYKWSVFWICHDFGEANPNQFRMIASIQATLPAGNDITLHWRDRILSSYGALILPITVILLAHNIDRWQKAQIRNIRKWKCSGVESIMPCCHFGSFKYIDGTFKNLKFDPYSVGPVGSLTR